MSWPQAIAFFAAKPLKRLSSNSLSQDQLPPPSPSAVLFATRQPPTEDAISNLCLAPALLFDTFGYLPDSYGKVINNGFCAKINVLSINGTSTVHHTAVLKNAEFPFLINFF